MVLNPNHMTIVVNDVEPAKAFFSLLGFEEGETKLISGEIMENYLGVPGIEAEHVTLVLKGCTPYFDIQLLKYNKPAPTQNEHVRDLTAVGYNHMCFAVDDFDATIAKLKAAGVKMRNGGMEFRNYKMAFIWGPEGITLELVQQLN
ncbi:putative lyase [Roseibium album]|nr:putative lyase [Roseibium album]